MDNMDGEEIERAEIDDLVQALHTCYELAKMPSMMIEEQHSNEEVTPGFSKSTFLFNKSEASAEDSFRKGEYLLAITAYTFSLCYAETKKEVARTYAKRSEALFKLGKYEECKLDIERALRANYPEDEWDTLVERYKRCIKSLRDVANSASSDQAKNGQKEAVEVNVVFVKQDMHVESSQLRNEFRNSLQQKTLNKIRLECNETWGRHMIATEDIKPGEILSCEKYFSLKVVGLGNNVRCSYCTCLSHALIPCKSCSMDMYCSMYCRIRAWDLYHRVECRIIRYKELRDVLSNTNLLALRMLLIGTNQGVGLETLMKELPMRDIFAEKIDPTTLNKPTTRNYLAALSLCRTFPKPLLVNSKPGVVVRLILALQKSGYFAHCSNQQTNTSSQKRLTDTELFAALLLVNHMVSVRTCTLTINFAAKVDQMDDSMGVAILHSMINHSCDSNSFYVTCFNENLLFAKRPISKGEQIFVTYRKICFGFTSLRARQELLADPFTHFRFTCKCAACIGHWPTYHEVVSKEAKEKFIGTTLKAEVKKFNEMIDLASVTGIERMNITEILDLISRVCEWLYVHLVRPSPALILGEVLLMSFMEYVHDLSFRCNEGALQIQYPRMLSAPFSTIKMVVNRGLNRPEGDIIESPTRFLGRSSRTRKR